MRLVAEHHDPAVLQAFAAWLSDEGIATEVVAVDRRWRLRVDDAHAREVALAYARFLQEPSHPARAPLPAAAPPIIDGSVPWSTWTLIGVAGAVSLFSDFAAKTARFAECAFADFFAHRGPLTGVAAFVDIRHGEIWRLFTPMFVHMGIWHLVFNAQWLHVLGSAIERRIGAVRMLALVATLAAASNTAQAVAHGPRFGGLSGVVYGLFGYFVVRAYRDPSLRWRIGGANLVLMLGWFALCFTGLVGPIANWAHAAGLTLGAVLGWATGSPRAPAAAGDGAEPTDPRVA